MTEEPRVRESLKFTVGYAKTVNLGNYESERYELQVEFLKNEVGIREAFESVIKTVKEMISARGTGGAALGSTVPRSEIQEKAQDTTPLRINASPEKKAGLGDLAHLPWQLYKDGKGSWIFANTKGAENLLKALQEAGGKITINGINYRLTHGQDRDFISRRRA